MGLRRGWIKRKRKVTLRVRRQLVGSSTPNIEGIII